MLADEERDCLAALAHCRRHNSVAGIAAREESVRHVREIDGFSGRTARFEGLVPTKWHALKLWKRDRRKALACDEVITGKHWHATR